MTAPRLLIVEDDPLESRLLARSLGLAGGVQTEEAASAEQALQRLADGGIDAVLSDLRMPGMDGIEMTRRIRTTHPNVPVLLMSAWATIEGAVDGLRAGAAEFLAKPVKPDQLLTLIGRHTASPPAAASRSTGRPQRTGRAALAGTHPRLAAVREFATRIASVPQARVLITGESGTGKSVLARLIHELSGVPGRFVEVNCAGLPPQLLESELFGYEKGAFTDAKALKRGLIEQADQGTLLLDEIGSMPLELQAKLLLFLDRQEVRRVGGSAALAVRTRVVAATNDDLLRRVRERAFRSDLLYRLDVASTELPPLRVMPSVIPELAKLFVAELGRELGVAADGVDEESLQRLVEYPWPGNARELRNAVERALIFHKGGVVAVRPPQHAALPEPSGLNVALGLTLEQVERRYIEATLDCRGSRLERVASDLGISRKTLWEKRRRYGL